MSEINLRALPSLQTYTNSELKLLATVAPARRYKPGDSLCEEGQSAFSCFVIVTGEVDVMKRFEHQEQKLATLEAGAIVGQMALVDKSNRSATLIAATPTIALELTRDVFERLLEAHSRLGLRFQHQIAVAGIRQLRVATAKLAEVLEVEVEESPSDADIMENPQRRGALLTVQTALSEWDMDLEKVDLHDFEIFAE
ncbi:MAG TPA: hypothetical protein DCQ06_02975 [Myxococcales bacterium]|nr:hypothetical protein [Myxococcales bacterium]HAN30537.1 hypothetical protein [Myxococcales bacterium]